METKAQKRKEQKEIDFKKFEFLIGSQLSKVESIQFNKYSDAVDHHIKTLTGHVLDHLIKIDSGESSIAQEGWLSDIIRDYVIAELADATGVSINLEDPSVRADLTRRCAKIAKLAWTFYGN